VDPLRVTRAVVIPAADLAFRAARASGPGGQNVNKVASKVDLRFDLEGTGVLSQETKARLRALPGVRLDAEGRVIVVVQDTRDQPRNLALARQRLAELIRRALVRPKKRKKTRATKASKRRRLDAKRRTSEKKRGRRTVGRDED
jgi:ribosome-associated protein